MREFSATKDTYEREQEEAERLVRKNPKYKPPRRDRRREDMEAERDPDTDRDPDLKGDPDMSLNYKNVGGSLDLRQYVRVALNEEKVKVRKKDDGKVVMVSPETLKDREKGSQYEVVEDEEEKPRTPSEEKREPADVSQQPASPSASKHQENHRLLSELAGQNPATESKLRAFFKSDLGYMAMGSPKDPNSGNPNLPAQPFFPEAKLPPSIKTLGDVAEALKLGPLKKPKAPAETPQPKADKPKAERPKGLTDTPEFQEAVKQHVAEAVKEALKSVGPEVAKAIVEGFKGIGGGKPSEAQAPAETPKAAPTPPPEAPKAEAPPKPPESEKKPPKVPDEAPKPKKKNPWEGKRPVDKREVEEVQTLVARTLPPRMASKFMSLHPDDAKQLVAAYDGMKKLGPFKDDGDYEQGLKNLKATFTLDPTEIAPPKTWRKGKKEIPFDQLTPEEQKTAHDSHRMQVLAMNVAMRERAISTLKKKGLPASLAAQSVDLEIAKPAVGKNPEDHAKVAAEESRKLHEATKSRFVAAVASDKEPISEADRRKALTATKSLNEKAQKLAYAELQANDYKSISEKYLTGPGGLSEHDPSSKFIAKMNAALDEFKTRSADYPKDVVKDNPDPAKVFRERVLARLQSENEVKYEAVREFFTKRDADEYDRDLKAFKKAEKSYEDEFKRYSKRFVKWQAERDAAEKAHSESQSPYRTSFDFRPPPEPPQQPISPVMPEGYYLVRRAQAPHTNKVKKQVDDIFHRMGLSESTGAADSDLKSKAKETARRVVDKLKSKFRRKKKEACVNPYSSYRYQDLTMGTPVSPGFESREAVYHGVDPYRKDEPFDQPYPEWAQAHRSDLGPSDDGKILSAAREWLKSPVLSRSIEGMVPDARFRAALDLAIRDTNDGKYSGAIDADKYNSLLKKLAGADAEGGATVHASSLRTEARVLAERVASDDPSLAYDLLAFSDAIQVVTAPRETVTVTASAAAADDLYEALRSSVIRSASTNASLRESLKPVLRLIKTIDEVRILRANSHD